MINRSIAMQKPWNEDKRKYVRGYKGDYSEGERKRNAINKDEAYVNFLYSYVETIGPSVFSGDPRFFAEAKRKDYEDASKEITAVVDYWFRELGARQHFLRCRFDSFFGHAAILTEWEYDEVLSEVPNILYVDPMTGKPVLGPPKKELMVLKDQPLLERIIPEHVILDPDSESPEKDTWRARRIIMLKSQFDGIKGIPDNVKAQVKGKPIPRDYTRAPFRNDQYQGSDSDWVLLYKIYDLENEEFLLLCEDEEVKDYLYVKPWEYAFEVENDRFPITILEAKPDPESCYTFSEIQAFWPQVQERNRLRTMLQSHTRRQHPAWIAKESANDEDSLDKFANAKIGEVVRLKTPDAIGVKPMPPFPVDSYNFDGILREDLVNTSLFYDYNNDSIADTATEASLLASRGNVIKNERKDKFGQFIGRVGGKVAQLCQEFMDKEVAIKIRDPQNPRAMIWKDVSAQDIQGEFLFTGKPGIIQNKDEALRRQQDLKLAEIARNNPHFDQRAAAVMLAEAFDREPDEVLRPLEEMKAEAASTVPEKPPITFDKIKIETLAPEVQMAIVQAALKQNGIDLGSLLQNPTVEAPSDPNQGGSMPGAEMNTPPPPLPGAGLPPITPIQAASEYQGGSSQMGGLS